MINSVLKNRYSQGYEDFSGEIIEKVNGVEVTDMNKLIEAVTHHSQKCHSIETRSGKQLVIPNVSYAESADLLQTYNIEHPCSIDLEVVYEQESALEDLVLRQVKALQFSAKASNLSHSAPEVAMLSRPRALSAKF